MLERSKLILKIACCALAAVLLYQLVQIGIRLNPLAHVAVPELPSLPTEIANQPGPGPAIPAALPVSAGKGMSNSAPSIGTNAVPSALATGTNAAPPKALARIETNSVSPPNPAEAETNAPPSLAAGTKPTNVPPTLASVVSGTNLPPSGRDKPAGARNIVDQPHGVPGSKPQTARPRARPDGRRAVPGGFNPNQRHDVATTIAPKPPARHPGACGSHRRKRDSRPLHTAPASGVDGDCR